jgi:hypothetical protein
MPFDAQLTEIGADDGERGNLGSTGERHTQMAHESDIVIWIEIAVTDQSGEEFGLVAGGIKMKLDALDDAIDDALAAVADKGDRVLAATFEREDQGSRRYCDRDAKGGGQRQAYGNTTWEPGR